MALWYSLKLALHYLPHLFDTPRQASKWAIDLRWAGIDLDDETVCAVGSGYCAELQGNFELEKLEANGERIVERATAKRIVEKAAARGIAEKADSKADNGSESKRMISVILVMSNARHQVEEVCDWVSAFLSNYW